MEKNENQSEQPEIKNKVQTIKWLYYPLLILSFIGIFLVAGGLGVAFNLSDNFMEGLIGIGIIYVWGLRENLKLVCAKGSGVSPLLYYVLAYIGYCGFLACEAYWGIFMGLLMFGIFLAILYLVYILFKKGNDKAE